jgi:hypothetical protein
MGYVRSVSGVHEKMKELLTSLNAINAIKYITNATTPAAAHGRKYGRSLKIANRPKTLGHFVAGLESSPPIRGLRRESDSTPD